MKSSQHNKHNGEVSSTPENHQLPTRAKFKKIETWSTKWSHLCGDKEEKQTYF